MAPVDVPALVAVPSVEPAWASRVQAIDPDTVRRVTCNTHLAEVHPMADREHLTLGLFAVRIGGGVQRHHLARLADRGLIPHSRAGRFRLVAVADLQKIRDVCRVAGYYRGPED